MGCDCPAQNSYAPAPQWQSANANPYSYSPSSLGGEYREVPKHEKEDSSTENKIEESKIKTDENEINVQTCQGTYDLDCPRLYILLDALQAFEMMDEVNFISYIQETLFYTPLDILNDFNHLILCHNDNLQQINEQLLTSKCSFKTCKFATRHFGPSNKNDLFLASIFDSLHVWLYHCFDAGFRLKETTKIQTSSNDNNLFDKEFDRINKAIRKTDSLTKPFERINYSKFSIGPKANETEQGDTTFIDELCGYLSNDVITAYLKQECFDTDSVKMDGQFYGNIKSKFENQNDEIIRFIKANSDTFSIGIRFYYWDYYKDIEELTAREQMINGNVDNRHDHSGYKVCELFIKPKYSTFKEEAMNYAHLNMNIYENKKMKAVRYLKTDEIRKVKAKKTDEFDMLLHYEINEHGKIQFDHLFALVLYCDLTKLSAAFSESFRKMTKYEKLQSIKKRNALFYWMSRRLRELVEIFGNCANGDTFERDNNGNYVKDENDNFKMTDPLLGYFYCGMSCKMNVDAFTIRLNGPTSTSKQFEVAVKFSGTKGMIFTFDNPKNDSHYCFLRGWDCSWISNFKEEDEVLYFGGFYPIKVVTLRLMSTHSNYKQYIEAIWYFDSMVNAAGMKMLTPSRNTFIIVSNLMNYALRRPIKANIDEYIIDTFLCYANNKKQIILNLDHLNRFCDSKMDDLILSTLDGRIQKNEVKRRDIDYSNLFLSDLLCLFPNVQTLITMSTNDDGEISYSFSLTALLSLISETNLNVIVVGTYKQDKAFDTDTAESKEYYPSWIETVWENEKDQLQNMFQKENFTIGQYTESFKDAFNLLIMKDSPR